MSIPIFCIFNIPSLYDLPPLNPFLIRTHKATCPSCQGRSETTDPHNRIVMCYHCNSMKVSKL
jgi:hypothetical protein